MFGFHWGSAALGGHRTIPCPFLLFSGSILAQGQEFITELNRGRLVKTPVTVNIAQISPTSSISHTYVKPAYVHIHPEKARASEAQWFNCELQRQP